MTRDRLEGSQTDDLVGLMEEVREEARALLEHFAIPREPATEILAHCWAVTQLSGGHRPERRRQFLAAVEEACREHRANQGPPEEEEENHRVH